MQTTIDPSMIPAQRQWRGEPLSPVLEVMMFLDGTGPVQDTFRRLRANLENQQIDYVVIGAFALAAHRFERATADIDLCVRAADLQKFRTTLLGVEYQNVTGRPRRFYDPQTQVTFDLLISGALAGRQDRNQVVRFPDPSEAVQISGFPTVSLESLIALKLVTWRLKDWADVVALIRTNQLEESFAARLPELIRSAYVQCVDSMREEDRYDPSRLEE